MTTIADVLGDTSYVNKAFDFMKAAEEEIAKAKRQHPEHENVIHSSFLILYPGSLMSLGEGIYRHHAREILGRVVRGEDVSVGTCAEVLAELYSVSLKKPLNQLGQATYERLFARVLPEQASKLFPDGPAQEPWDGAVEEEIARIRKKMSKDRTKAS